MADRPLFEGRLIRLSAIDPERDPETISKWFSGSEFQMLEDSTPARPYSTRYFVQDQERRVQNEGKNSFSFGIRTIDSGRLVGWIELDGIEWQHGSAWTGIGIGLPEDWNQGYGSDAMREVLRFAYTELNLQRVSLNVFEYNPRAVHLYEKLGFQVEGRVRGYLNRMGKRWDVIYMGLLRSEWRDE